MRTLSETEEAKSPTGLTFEQIEAMSLYDMLKMWRFAHVGTFQAGDPVSDAFIKRMIDLKNENPAGWVAASKSLGWDR